MGVMSSGSHEPIKPAASPLPAPVEPQAPMPPDVSPPDSSPPNQSKPDASKPDQSKQSVPASPLGSASLAQPTQEHVETSHGSEPATGEDTPPPAETAEPQASWGGCPIQGCAGFLTHDPRGAFVWPRHLVLPEPQGRAHALELESATAHDKAGEDLCCSLCGEAFTEVVRGRRPGR